MFEQDYCCCPGCGKCDAAEKVEQLLEENRQLRGTSTPETEASIRRLAFNLGVTLGRLDQTGGRELECVLQRLERAEADVRALESKP